MSQLLYKHIDRLCNRKADTYLISEIKIIGIYTVSHNGNKVLLKLSRK